MVSPSPTPFLFIPSLTFNFPNSLNSFPISSSCIPIPVSFILNFNTVVKSNDDYSKPSSSIASIVMLPVKVNLIEFPSKLKRICLKRFPSVKARTGKERLIS